MIVGPTLLVLAVTLLSEGSRRRFGSLGLAALALGLAAHRTVPLAGAPVGYASVTAGLLLLGLAVPAGAVALAFSENRQRSRAALAMIVTGVALTAWAVVPLLARAGLLRTGLVAAALGAGGWVAAAAGRRLPLGPALRRRERSIDRLRPAPTAVVVGATLVAGFGGHVVAILAANITAAWAAWLAVPRPARRLPLGTVAVTLPLLLSLWLLTAIRGPEGLALEAIPSLPLSPAAVRLLGLLLLAAVVGLAGPWPLRQPVDGVLTAAAGALLLVRVAIPAVPDGLLHWQPLAFPIVVLGLWHSALVRRPASLAVLGACAGLVTLLPGGLSGAGWLLVAGAGVLLLDRRDSLPGRALVAIVAWWGALGVLAAGLATETVYTVLGAAAGAAGVAGGSVERPAPDRPAR